MINKHLKTCFLIANDDFDRENHYLDLQKKLQEVKRAENSVYTDHRGTSLLIRNCLTNAENVGHCDLTLPPVGYNFIFLFEYSLHSNELTDCDCAL